MFEEKFTLMYKSNGTVVVREFTAEDLWELSHNMLQFTRSVGYDYVDMLEFSTPDGDIYRAEVLDD